MNFSNVNACDFCRFNVLELSSGIDELGSIRWPLFLCLLVAWVLVFLCLSKGIRSSGKVVYVTATVPYVFLTLLLIRGLMLPGAVDGILFYIKPDFKQLTNVRVSILLDV
jgi:SNF family Na+-dependent transporter